MTVAAQQMAHGGFHTAAGSGQVRAHFGRIPFSLEVPPGFFRGTNCVDIEGQENAVVTSATNCTSIPSSENSTDVSGSTCVKITPR